MQTIETRPRRTTAEDIVHEGPIDARHLGDMGWTQAELQRAGVKPVGHSMVFGHLIPKGLWIRLDKIGLR